MLVIALEHENLEQIHIFFLHSTYSWGGDNLHATMLIIKKEDYVHTFNPKELRAYT